MASGGIGFTEDTLTHGISTLPEVISRAVAFTMLKNEAPAENYMKQNAPWNDQTTNARNGLAARYAGEHRGNHVLVLFHQVDYGIWLEVKYEGRNAIILPTVQEFGPKIMGDLANILDRIHAGGAP